MAAANSKGGILAGTLGKRLVHQIWPTAARDPALIAAPAASAYLRKRGVHASAYDKNVDDHVRPVVVPDDVIDLKSDYWEPNPKTGVFGPSGVKVTSTATEEKDEPAGGATSSSSSSTLDQVAWFRPLEDVEKPRHD